MKIYSRQDSNITLQFYFYCLVRWPLTTPAFACTCSSILNYFLSSKTFILTFCAIVPQRNIMRSSNVELRLFWNQLGDNRKQHNLSTYQDMNQDQLCRVSAFLMKHFLNTRLGRVWLKATATSIKAVMDLWEMDADVRISRLARLMFTGGWKSNSEVIHFWKQVT